MYFFAKSSSSQNSDIFDMAKRVWLFWEMSLFGVVLLWVGTVLVYNDLNPTIQQHWSIEVFEDKNQSSHTVLLLISHSLIYRDSYSLQISWEYGQISNYMILRFSLEIIQTKLTTSKQIFKFALIWQVLQCHAFNLVWTRKYSDRIFWKIKKKIYPGA